MQYLLIRRFNIVEISILPKVISRFNIITIKIPGRFFIDIDKLILKFSRKSEVTIMATSILKKKDKLRRITLSNDKIYYIATVN